MASKWENEKELLNELINVNHESYESIGKRFNISGSAIKKAARRIGIKLPKRRKINPKETFNKRENETAVCCNCGKEFLMEASKYNKFCSIKCSSEHKHKEKYKDFLSGKDYYMRANYTVSIFKDIILAEQDGKCAVCGCGCEHNGKPLVFILDHIDGNAANNKRENLRCVCPNCDSQLPTFKHRNKHSARTYRYNKK